MRNLHQAGRIHNLHQVCGNSGCLGNVVKLTGQIEFIIHCGTMYHSKQSAMLGGSSTDWLLYTAGNTTGLMQVCNENSTWYLKACCNLYVSGCVQICMRIIINFLSDQIRTTATISSFQASCPFVQLFLICQSKWRKKSRYEVTCKSSIENLLLQINSTALPFASSWCLCSTSQLYECSRKVKPK